MGMNYNEIIQLIFKSYNQNQINNPQFSLQLKQILKAEQVISNYNEFLKNKIKMVKILSHTVELCEWAKLLQQVWIQKQCFQNQSFLLIGNLRNISFIDEETIQKMKKRVKYLTAKSYCLQQYLIQVKVSIKHKNYEYCPILRKFVYKRGNGKLIQLKKYLREQDEDEDISWQEKGIIFEAEEIKKVNHKEDTKVQYPNILNFQSRQNVYRPSNYYTVRFWVGQVMIRQFKLSK